MLKLFSIFSLLVLGSIILNFSQKGNKAPVVLPVGMGKSYNTWNDSFFPPKIRPEGHGKTLTSPNVSPVSDIRDNEKKPADSKSKPELPYFMRWMNVSSGGDGC